MSLHPNLEEQEALAETFHRIAARMSARELVAELVVGIGFVAAVLALLLLRPPHGFDLAPALLCFVVLLAATCVCIDTPFGFTVPTQLAFVPLVFAMPLSLVPIAVAGALSVSRLRAVLRHEVPASRLLKAPGNAWFALGPVAVFALAGVRPQAAGPALLVAALAAQFAADFASCAVRLAIDRGVKLSAHTGAAWVYLVDAALSGVAFVVAKHVRTAPGATWSRPTTATPASTARASSSSRCRSPTACASIRHAGATSSSERSFTT